MHKRNHSTQGSNVDPHWLNVDWRRGSSTASAPGGPHADSAPDLGTGRQDSHSTTQRPTSSKVELKDDTSTPAASWPTAPRAPWADMASTQSAYCATDAHSNDGTSRADVGRTDTEATDHIASTTGTNTRVSPTPAAPWAKQAGARPQQRGSRYLFANGDTAEESYKDFVNNPLLDPEEQELAKLLRQYGGDTTFGEIPPEDWDTLTRHGYQGHTVDEDGKA